MRDPDNWVAVCIDSNFNDLLQFAGEVQRTAREIHVNWIGRVQISRVDGIGCNPKGLSTKLTCSWCAVEIPLHQPVSEYSCPQY